MKKNYISIIASLLLSVGANINAQTTIYNQNFDSLGLSLPTGWTSTASGWVLDSATANRSTGHYTGASGLFNCVIKNGAAISGTFTLTTNSISTIGFTNISVLWGARKTTHFPDSLSAISTFDFSTDGGLTWNNITYTENTNNSTWSLDNAGSRIALPSMANNQASVIFRWVANLNPTPSGTYRIDDFNVAGLDTSSGIDNVTKENANIFVSNNTLYLNLPKVNEQMNLTIFNSEGQLIKSNNVIKNVTSYQLPDDISSGLYFITLISDNKVYKTKFVKR